jgi:hypothetical protein
MNAIVTLACVDLAMSAYMDSCRAGRAVAPYRPDRSSGDRLVLAPDGPALPHVDSSLSRPCLGRSADQAWC